MLRFPYLEEPLVGLAPPSLRPATTSRWRPLIPIRILGPSGQSRLFLRAVVDPGSDDCVFPWNVAILLGVPFLGQKHALGWRGQ